MKITAKQFAETLYDSVEGKTEKEILSVLNNFSEIVKKNNALSMIDNILDEFSRIWNKENGIIEAKVTSARDLDKTNRKSIIEYIKEATKAKDVVLAETVDKKVLGGVILKYGDKIVDDSLLGRVRSLGRTLEK